MTFPISSLSRAFAYRSSIIFQQVRASSSYKLKTHKGASKRFIPINGGAQFKRGKAYKGHLNYGVSQSNWSSLRNSVILQTKAQLKTMKKLLPYAK
ncbi:hypothetical protein BKA69DRAFT_1125382 [Paraphysoderma sedebokerense]|nr:hypothetical protein BKA69DRAFT_1125382 [Paraphysoderma sedebokerense]